MDMNVNEMISAICGKDEDGQSKTITGCYLYSFVPGSEEEHKEINSCTSHIATVDIFPYGDKVQVDITFTNEADVDLNKMCQMLDKCRQLQRSDDGRNYYIMFNFLPMNMGETNAVAIEGVMPMIHCLTALIPQGQISTLRLLFEGEYMNFYCADEIDAGVMDREVDFELRKRSDAIDHYKKKRQEKEEYLQKIEDLTKR
jgi:hypothetical protein